MKKGIVLGALAALFQLQSVAAKVTDQTTDPRYFEIVSGTIEEINEDGTSDSQIQFNPPVTVFPEFPSPGTSPGIGSDGFSKANEIINLGERIWKFIVDNRPVVNVQNLSANALPSKVTTWEDLENWDLPQSKKYRAAYTNGFGSTVVDITYRLQFTPGGTYEGTGKYLANVTIVPENLTVAWGYAFDAQVQIGQIINRGSKKNPLAGMELNILWSIKTPLKESRENVGFFVQGDGKTMVR